MGAGLYVSNRLCLDFVNTVSWRGSEEPRELLTDYNTLVRWSRGAGILNPAQAADLRRQARSDPERAEAVVAQARELREALYRNVTAWCRRTPVRKGDLGLVNRALERAPERRAIRRRGRSFGWDVETDHRPLDHLLWPVSWSAADLLIHDDPARIKSCADSRCAWLFYDTSRNRSRRWCSMEDCGNRAKARRHYRRARGSS